MGIVLVSRLATNIKAGDLRYQVIIEKPKASSTEDGTGHIDLNDDANWVEVCRRFANPQSLGGSEVVINDKIVAIGRWSVEMRYDRLTSEMTTPYRIRYDGRKLNIQSVSDPDGRKRRLFVDCIEKI